MLSGYPYTPITRADPYCFSHDYDRYLGVQEASEARFYRATFSWKKAAVKTS